MMRSARGDEVSDASQRLVVAQVVDGHAEDSDATRRRMIYHGWDPAATARCTLACSALNVKGFCRKPAGARPSKRLRTSCSL
jgi:hypothetical protein